ncbi:hypothetical protein [Haloarcula salinisoli]|uniref:Uncharacterized protein n=1 Tax=Haloarcula salinisoli TaxID=2487746 RepID=A0A8J8C7T8_9EURY|nr:hypothetical protein [Halomicroarcula salinisoli]MBX0286068.1 hypothetical protein [Halomicroarcula salinisoli]MBX0302444.1 hypothetical protein [Halomicroarcula salinisoli]
MTETGLGIHDHRIVAAAVEDHSVTRWRCLDCAREFDCVTECLSNDCGLASPSNT